ncbi:MAG: hypothetical protein R3B49_11615 [Phycisphaerales bacterium]
MNLLTSAAIASMTLLGGAGVRVMGTAVPAVHWVVADPGESVTGIVDQVDLVLGSFTLKGEGDTSEKYTWDGETEFTLDGEKSTASQVLEKGAEVTVSADENGVASSVSRQSE